MSDQVPAGSADAAAARQSQDGSPAADGASAGRAEAAVSADDRASRRLLLVHAHPDDETINSGATMAMYAAAGVAVTLVTCTLGDEGEILVPAVAHLAADRDDALGVFRQGELDAATAELGIDDVRHLGGAGSWRDSGMAGSPAHSHPRSFVNAPMQVAAAQLADIIAEVRPQVVVTYDANGGYGHPDHIKAHDVTHAAVAAVCERWAVSKVYACARRRLIEVGDRAELAALGAAAPFAIGTDALEWAVDDSVITTAIDASAFTARKAAALRAHATQVSVSDDERWYALSDGIGARLRGIEYYTCVLGRPAGNVDEDGFETDLFAGLP